MTVPSIPKNQKTDRSIQQYRDIKNIYYEPGLISILILSCGKHNIFKTCLSTTLNSLKDYDGDLEYILLEQAFDINPEDAKKNIEYFNKMTSDIDRTLVIMPSRNGGINYGINQLWQLSRGEYILFLENDWFCNCRDEKWLLLAKTILDDHQDIGILQLRAIDDPNENWGFRKPEYSPWSCEGQPDIQKRTAIFNNNHIMFYVAKKRIYGVNNNPALWRKDMRNELGCMSEPELWSDLRYGETAYQEKFMVDQWEVAHIRVPVYYHYPLYLRK